MIPYFELKTIAIGPLTIYVWGLFVALGIIAGLYVARWYASKHYLDAKIISDLAGWIVLAAIIGGRLFHVLFYDPQTYLSNPVSILHIWEGGMSIFGGFAGAILVGIIFLRKRKVDVWAYADAVLFGLPWGLFLGRIGCFLIHDHPGTATNFFLGVEYPDGLVRHDHGLYLSILGLLIGLLFLSTVNKNKSTGYYIALFAIIYGLCRLWLDEFRLIDVTYASLTPAQYLSFILAAFGIYLLIKIKKRKIK